MTTTLYAEALAAQENSRFAARSDVLVREATEHYPPWLGFPVSGDHLAVHRVVRDAAVRQTVASFGLVDR